MRFDKFDFDGRLLRAVQKQGFTQTTPVQEQAFPGALQGRDILGTAQTGTGKTVAFLLPSLHQLLKGEPQKRPRMLILAPTRELALQIAEEARALACFTSLRVVALFGGAAINPQTKQLRRGVDLVVATPGRLKDHLQRRNLRLDGIQILVLDEADRMLDMGFYPDIEAIVRRLPDQRQTMLFSATMPQAILGLAGRFMQSPLRIEIQTAKPPEAIEQRLYPVPKHLKAPLLAALLQREGVESALVFTRTKQQADILARKLREEGFSLAIIHGDFNQQKRLRALERFRAGSAKILVATNVAARGLDIEGISHVINFDVPEEAENYVHRIGRTARVQAEGVAWTLVTPDDEGEIAAIEYLLGEKIPRLTLPGFDYDVPAPDWAKPSAAALLRKARRKQGNYGRWKSLAR